LVKRYESDLKKGNPGFGGLSIKKIRIPRATGGDRRRTQTQLDLQKQCEEETNRHGRDAKEPPSEFVEKQKKGHLSTNLS